MTDTNNPDSSGQPGAEPPTQPPVEQAHDSRPRPRFGEYAPPGYVSPVTPPEPPLAPHSTTAPGDNLPGYPPPGYPTGAPVGYPAPPATTRKPRTWDLILTIVLLAFGLVGALVGAAGALGATTSLTQFYSQQGLTDYVAPSNADALVTTIVASHIVLYVIALVGSILLLRKQRLAFWLPLVIGIIATIIFWTAFTTLVLADPAFTDYVQQQSGL